MAGNCDGKLCHYKCILLSGFQLFTLQLGPSEVAIMDNLAQKFLGSSDMAVAINFATAKWDLTSKEGRADFLGNCSMPRLDVDCVDDTLDLCPNGHLAYGLATIFVVVLPGLLFALSSFAKHRAFVLIDIDKPYGKNMNLAAKLLTFPFYAVLMVPLVMITTTYT